MKKLTKDEKFLLAVMVGVQIEMVPDVKGAYHLRTTNKCGIMWEDENTPVVIEAIA